MTVPVLSRMTPMEVGEIERVDVNFKKVLEKIIFVELSVKCFFSFSGWPNEQADVFLPYQGGPEEPSPA